MTMNFVRALIDGGFADLHHPNTGTCVWVQHSPLSDEYHAWCRGRRRRALHGERCPAQACTTSTAPTSTPRTSAAAAYERALTRQVPRQWGWFNLSTHFPWIGMRTAALDGAHVEYSAASAIPSR
jgi:3-deoxy-7-phosphoheptulonate synthase